eukprot:TRINITY_DN977_c1_g3_i1.p3 TRINITY_DN977_c1_g3~~TRINITY_DN977_c1_g3_i1.p3  ORF type:complete len:154 (+),score=17.02 TRINITY_DN977_c1_g3_i1:69-464(+)
MEEQWLAYPSQYPYQQQYQQQHQEQQYHYQQQQQQQHDLAFDSTAGAAAQAYASAQGRNSSGRASNGRAMDSYEAAGKADTAARPHTAGGYTVGCMRAGGACGAEWGEVPWLAVVDPAASAAGYATVRLGW